MIDYIIYFATIIERVFALRAHFRYHIDINVVEGLNWQIFLVEHLELVTWL
jgi:hypothetical protein